MPIPLLPTLFIASLATATLSATFGMAGGLVLMGVYTALLPVPEAMVLHGVTQLVANGGRAWLLREHVSWRGVAGYAVGAALAAGIVSLVRFVPSPTVVYLGIGALPFAAALLPESPALDFARRRGAVLCGALVVGLQLLVGVAGPLLDVFFVRTTLLRREVVSTKAITQTLSHALKIGVFLPMLGDGSPATGSLPAVSLPTAALVSIGGALVGTWLGGRLLERVSEEHFRRWTRRLVMAVGAVYLVKGVAGMVAVGG